MVSKNNQWQHLQVSAQRVPHYGLRKFSVGVASVLLSTTLYMGVSAHADTVNSQDYETLDSKVVNNSNSNSSNGYSVVDRGTSAANTDNSALGDSHAVTSVAEVAVKNEANAKSQTTEINNDGHMQSGVANVDAKSDDNTSSNEMTSAVATETSPVPMSPSASSSSQGTVTAPVEGDASNKANSQVQPSSVTNTTQTKLSHRPVMRLAAVPTTNSDELIVGKDVTISDFSVTATEGKNEFENAHANIKFTMHADDPSALAGKRLTIRVDTKVWGGFYSSEQQDSNSATISYQGHVIGTLSYGYPFDFVYITFNDDVKDYTKIDVQADLVIAGLSQRDIPYRTSLYTPTQAKDGQTYYLTNDVTIGQQKYSSNLPSVIHYYPLDSVFVSSVTDVTTTSYAQGDSKLYAGTFYKTPNGIYYSQSLIYGGNNLYSEQSGQSGYLERPDVYVGTDIITEHTQSYTVTSDIDQTKLSPASGSKLVPTKSYYLTKYYWDDKDLLPNTRDVYVDQSNTDLSTVTGDATVTKDGVIFNKLNGKSLVTQMLNVEYTNNHVTFTRHTNYVTQTGKLYLTPALFKQLQAVAESDQNLAEAVNTVKTTGMDAKIKLVNPIDTGFKATIKTSDGKTKELPLMIDTIDYQITTASTAPKGAILVAAQGKTVKVYHHGDQNIPAVVDQNKLTKIITRTINVHKPGEKVITIKQAVVLTQSVSVVDGKDVTYNGDWKVQGNSSWDSYDAPVASGYTANYPHVDSQSVSDTTEDQTIEITYVANAQTTHINYVDTQGKTIHTTTVNGQTGQTVKVSSEIPDGWKLVDGQMVPNEITFGPDGKADMSVKIEHQHVTVQPDAPKTPNDKLPDKPSKSYPSGVAKDDLSKTVTRTIKVITPDDQTKVVAQTAKLTRTADVDEVTGEVTYGKWTTGEWISYDVPTIPGYTASQSNVAKEAVTGVTKDQTVNVTYTANPQTTTVVYQTEDGTPVHITTVKGQTGQTVKVSNEVPVGWKIINGKVSSEITFGPNGTPQTIVTIAHQRVTVDPDHPQNNGTKLPDNSGKTFNGVEANDLNKTITRTIEVTMPDGQTKTVAQTAKLTRTANVDEVTGEVTYCNWTTGEWAAYNTPSVAGYTSSQTTVAKEGVTAVSKDTMVEISYLPVQHQISVEYVDDDDHGKIVKTDQVPGKTDQTITVTPSAPANYDLVNNGNRTYTVTSNDAQAIQIHVKHHQVTTSESKMVTRTIDVHTPHDGTKTIKQNAKLTRDVTTDQVTGEKTYGDWSATEWDRYAVPAVAGYVPSIEQVAQQVVNGTTTDQTIDVTYSSGEHTTHINYVDGDGNIVHTTTIKGQTDGTVQVPNETPAGWTVVGEPVPTELAFGPDGHADVTVTVAHQHVTVTPDQPKTPTDKLLDNPAKTYPNGVGHDDLNKTVTRTIKVTMPDGQTKTVAQTAKLTRTANVDEVIGEVTYGNWTTGEWSSYDVPTVPGYTPSQSAIPTAKVTNDTKDQTLTVTYTANDQTTHINYVDSNGKIVHTTTITGKTNQTVKVPNEVPTGWKITSGQVPNEITFGANGHDDVTVTVDHQYVTVTPDQPQPDGTPLPDNPSQTFHGVTETDLNKTITRTIIFNVPGQNPRTTTQTAKLTRTATVDEVTGEVTYGDWTTAKWPAVTVPVVDGYTTSQAQIPAVTVEPTTDNQTVTVDYQAVEVPTAKPEARSTAASHTSGTKPMEMPTTYAKVVSPGASATPVVSAAKASQLPQTGADKVASTIMTSLGLLMGALSAFVFGRKKKDKGHKA